MLRKTTTQPATRIFVGTSANGEDAEACAVFERSLRRHTSMGLDIEWLRLSRDSQSPCYSSATGAGWNTERWVTPWTALRWAVPEICGFQGRAIYFDCATLVLGDVAELVEAHIPSGALALMKPVGRRISAIGCILFDCVEARKHFPLVADMQRDVGAHQEIGHLLERRSRLVQGLPAGWGASDTDFSRSPGTEWKSVCFTSLHTQPHVPRARARLHADGCRHWFDGMFLPHYCQRLVDLYQVELDAVTLVDEYVPKVAYGEYTIQSVDRVARKERA